LTPDSEWIAEIGQRGWVAVTRDKRTRYTPLALETLMTSGARLFIIVGRLTNEEAAETFVRQSKKAENLLRKESKPFIAKIRREAVEVWLRERQWRSR